LEYLIILFREGDEFPYGSLFWGLFDACLYIFGRTKQMLFDKER